MAIVLGYHGCSARTAHDLLSGSQFNPSNKPYDWLGSGSYFWESDILRAYEWAKERRSSAPCIVGAVIELGNCLDLTTQAGVRAVKVAYESYVNLQKKTGNALPKNKAGENSKPGDRVLRYLDRAVIDHLHANYKASQSGGMREFDTVRALFPEGYSIYEDAGFWDKTHVQIAVRRQTQILGVFRVPMHQLKNLDISDPYACAEFVNE
ncbi:MAG TPA: hypothetical protein VFE38_06555 [Edaphobacter sp.]|nr:hypothetical protein [Edaphobacter sp.]